MDVAATGAQAKTVFSDPKLPSFHPAFISHVVLLYFHPSFHALEEHLFLFGVSVPAVPRVFPPAQTWLQVFAVCLGSHGFGSGSWEGHGVLWEAEFLICRVQTQGMMI